MMLIAHGIFAIFGFPNGTAEAKVPQDGDRLWINRVGIPLFAEVSANNM